MSLFGRRRRGPGEVREQEEFHDPGVINNAYAVDLGTCNIKIYNAASDKILVQKNMIAVKNKKTMIAYGDNAYEMFERAPANIRVSSGERCILQISLWRFRRMSPKWSGEPSMI